MANAHPSSWTDQEHLHQDDLSICLHSQVINPGRQEGSLVISTSPLDHIVAFLLIIVDENCDGLPLVVRDDKPHFQPFMQRIGNRGRLVKRIGKDFEIEWKRIVRLYDQPTFLRIWIQTLDLTGKS